MDVCTWNDSQCVYTCAGYGLRCKCEQVQPCECGKHAKRRVLGLWPVLVHCFVSKKGD